MSRHFGYSNRDGMSARPEVSLVYDAQSMSNLQVAAEAFGDPSNYLVAQEKSEMLPETSGQSTPADDGNAWCVGGLKTNPVPNGPCPEPSYSPGHLTGRLELYLHGPGNGPRFSRPVRPPGVTGRKYALPTSRRQDRSADTNRGRLGRLRAVRPPVRCAFLSTTARLDTRSGQDDPQAESRASLVWRPRSGRRRGRLRARSRLAHTGDPSPRLSRHRPP
jgi:hypothetical protein